MEEPSMNELPDELIFKIFSLLPMFKESVATHIISKRWVDPWKLVPDVVFDDDDESSENFVMSFVYGSLLFNKAQVLERLHLKLSQNYSVSDINFFVKIAVDRSVRKLRIQLFGKTLELPSSLCTCVTLKSLILHEVCIKVGSPWFRLPSLRSLHLLSVKFWGNESVASLLQLCPDLKNLVVKETNNKNVMFKFVQPLFLLSSLKSLHLLSVNFSGDESAASLLTICPVLEDLVVNQTKVFSSNLSTWISCRTLKTLTLRELSINVVPPSFRLPSLKTMHLSSVKFSEGESVVSLLQICPVLEDLVVNQTKVHLSTWISCRTIKTLILRDLSIVPPSFCLLSLKTMHLSSVKFSEGNSIVSLLQNCPFLEDLVVNQAEDDDVMFKVVPPSFCLPSLKTMHLSSVKFSEGNSVVSLLQNCPVLEYLVINQAKDDNVMFKVVLPSFYLPSLKTMHLSSVKFLDDESVAKFLESCAVLSNLVVNKTRDDNVMIFNIKVPSLRSLSIGTSKGKGAYVEENHGFVINAPSLEKLEFKDTFSNFLKFEHMPKVIMANIEVTWISCRTLKTLILRELSINVSPPSFRLSSLKTMHLSSVKFSEGESVVSLLQICPFLEYLVVNQAKDDDVMFKILPPSFCLPSLKTLHLSSVKFSGDESVAKFLESCAVLDALVVNKTRDDNVMIFNIKVPSLRSLSIDNSKGKRAFVEENHGFVINAPSLEKLEFKDTFSNFLNFEHMPKVIMANIEVICDKPEKFIGSLTSIQHLSFCSLTSETPYPRDTFFFFLEHLELCTCSAGWSNLLACILNDAPRLRSVKLKSQHRAHYSDPMNLWNEPTVVPECLSTHLEILEWRQYEGTEQERKVAAYILANATCLKMATFSTRCRNKYHRMLRKLKNLKRVSETCQLVFE